MLSGACGHTYGNHNIWQMLEPGRDPVSFARTGWRFAINHPGAFQAGYMRRLFESLPRSEEHTSELQSLMRISYAVFCLKKKNTKSKPQATTRCCNTSRERRPDQEYPQQRNI